MTRDVLLKVGCFIASAIGGLFLLVGVSAWIQGGIQLWPAEELTTPSDTPVPPGHAYTPEVSIVWVESSLKSRKHRFSLEAANMDPSVRYELRLQASTVDTEEAGRNVIGFNPDCSESEWTGEFSPHSRQNRTSDSQSVALYACGSEGRGRIRVELVGGGEVLGVHTERVEVLDFVPR